MLHYIFFLITLLRNVVFPDDQESVKILVAMYGFDFCVILSLSLSLSIYIYI